MVRRYRKRIVNRDKYSVEQTAITTPFFASWTTYEATSEFEQNSQQFSIPIVQPVDFQGMRKIKHLTISFTSSTAFPIYYAIIYCPQGYTPQPLHLPASGSAITFYGANQFIMSSGVLDFTGGPCRIHCRLARNLNSGDGVYLALATTSASATSNVSAHITYAVTLQ